MKKLIISLSLLIGFVAFAQKGTKTDSTKVKDIQEVVMTKKVFQKKSDRFIYDVAASPVAKGNTAFGLLKETPLISSTDDKTLRIAGKSNAVIFIDGRVTQMDAESLVQFLKNTPAENIQRIEVITMPGSEYKVESSDGIINIVLKKKSSNGLNGSMRMNNQQNYYNASGAGLSLNYRKDKLGINTNINTSENIEEQYYILKNGNSESTNRSEGRITDPNKNLGGYLNIDYQLNDKNSLALTYNSRANRSYNSTANLFNTTTDLVKQETEYTWTKSKEDARSYNNSVNLNYELKTDSLGSKLNLNVAGLFYKRLQSANNFTIASDQYGNDDGNVIKIYQEQPQRINNFSATADYVQKFKKDLTVSVGGNFNKTKTDNDTKYDRFYFITDSLTSEPNHFLYDENIFGAYVTVEKVFSPKFSGKIGARYELTQSEGNSDNAQDENLRNIKRDYDELLPYLSMNYAINDKNNLSYAFSSRMRRPSFWELNPVRNVLTEFNYTQNNPFVKASSVYSHELTYMYKSSYFLILSHTLTKDEITQVPLQGVIDGKNQLRYIRTNFGDNQEMSAMLGMQKSFFKGYLSSNFNIGVQRNINNGSLSQDPLTGDIFPLYQNNVKSNSLLIQTDNNIQLDKNKTWFLGVNYFYVDKQQIELGQLHSLMSLDFNLKKLWNQWTFSLGLDDILNTNKIIIEDYQKNGNYNYVNQNQYNRGVELTIVYNFGNQKVKKVRSIDSADKEIKSRTK
ncbi:MULTISPECIES: TonB-dependent receptor domain-containing protein [unclassified Kaistella]|uniref:TonB-dependent receptor domain-containing protein n=1 Tax=unclassified Kaistella TaxID=2762626 RepID=UPI00273573CF|nr:MULTISPECIES: TonB-dependent receptor [unclassified Kaistella]MDP2452665.1 TonB-dependent receptor [Kaistella sp. SH11-4b]MDP2455574.1 TonB-dependent receptor [Kaistella sp. SH40-3]MDP2458478.1 TonB-dependent receptor [Kaistella sp. SH19-2b]